MEERNISIEDYYNSTGKVITISTGTWGSTYVESCATIRCGLNPASGNEIFIAEREGLMADYKMFCDADVSIDETKKFTENSIDYDVVFVKDTFNMGHHKKVMLKRRG